MNDLLVRLWPKIPIKERKKAPEGYRISSPSLQKRKEEPVTPTSRHCCQKMTANEQLFSASRSAPTGFSIEDLRSIKDELLYRLSSWFHLIYRENVAENPPKWLTTFKELVFRTNGDIISFNWDLVLDELLFDGQVSAETYGLTPHNTVGPTLIKPHGSLNWYDENSSKNIQAKHRIPLHKKIFAFDQFREPHSQFDRKYSPIIVPPVFNKEFKEDIFEHLWRKSVSSLSTAEKVVFIGYSLPDADVHARFILRCGFYNQMAGLPVDEGRADATGTSKVVIVNPDVGAARRIEAVCIGSESEWEPYTAERWISRL